VDCWHDAPRHRIAVDASMLAGRLHQPTVQDILTANKIVRYLKGSSSHAIVYRKLKTPLRVLAYSDSAFQNLDQGSRTQPSRPSRHDRRRGLSWMSPYSCEHPSWRRHCSHARHQGCADELEKQSPPSSCTERSTFSAELLASTNSFDRASWFASLFAEMSSGIKVRDEIPIDPDLNRLRELGGEYEEPPNPGDGEAPLRRNLGTTRSPRVIGDSDIQARTYCADNCGRIEKDPAEATVQVAQRHRRPDGEEEEETGWVLARM
jgi:hypothetical protein